MVTAKVRVKNESRKVVRASKAGSITSLGRAGAYIRGIAKRMVKISPVPSEPGKPPHSRKGRLKRAICFSVEQGRVLVVIGPTADAVGRIAHTHEFGGTEPPKKNRKRQANYRLEVGGHGPIAIGPGGPVVVKLRTEHQVARAHEVAQSLPPSQGGPPSTKARRFPPRPLMAPALKVSQNRLPAFWRNSVRGG